MNERKRILWSRAGVGPENGDLELERLWKLQ
jgi:hypothetical protein